MQPFHSTESQYLNPDKWKKPTSKDLKYQQAWGRGKQYGPSDLRDKSFSALIYSVHFCFQHYMPLARTVWCCELVWNFNFMNNSQSLQWFQKVMAPYHTFASVLNTEGNIYVFLESVVLSWKVSAVQLNINKNSYVLMCTFFLLTFCINTGNIFFLILTPSLKLLRGLYAGFCHLSCISMAFPPFLWVIGILPSGLQIGTVVA